MTFDSRYVLVTLKLNNIYKFQIFKFQKKVYFSGHKWAKRQILKLEGCAGKGLKVNIRKTKAMVIGSKKEVFKSKIN